MTGGEILVECLKAQEVKAVLVCQGIKMCISMMHSTGAARE